GAIAALRLASRTLRYAMMLKRQRGIPHSSLLVVLSATRSLERFGLWLGLGDRQKRRQRDQRSNHII
ncbi:MAG: hypothetical protein E6833_17140, partial [Bradyrhizobium sp.]|nr:hypothetical protein [Bradyrhizobium sp.]